MSPNRCARIAKNSATNAKHATIEAICPRRPRRPRERDERNLQREHCRRFLEAERCEHA